MPARHVRPGTPHDGAEARLGDRRRFATELARSATVVSMEAWNVTKLDLQPHAPEILSSSPDARAIAIAIPAGEALDEHQVHERAWVTVLEGDVEITPRGGQPVRGSAGLLVEFDPGERHSVRARSDARILLLLAPWPGNGHPGAMSTEQKAGVRERAAERKQQA
ncbi:MAG: hypothetical protein NVSMB51_12250 [Solirubrobacteraceae bacterium]